MKDVRIQTASLHFADRSKIKSVICHLPSVISIVLLVSVITWGFFYGILAEQETRELKQTTGWHKWLHKRALAEYYADDAYVRSRGLATRTWSQ